MDVATSSNAAVGVARVSQWPEGWEGVRGKAEPRARLKATISQVQRRTARERLCRERVRPDMPAVRFPLVECGRIVDERHREV